MASKFFRDVTAGLSLFAITAFGLTSCQKDTAITPKDEPIIIKPVDQTPPVTAPPITVIKDTTTTGTKPTPVVENIDRLIMKFNGAGASLDSLHGKIEFINITHSTNHKDLRFGPTGAADAQLEFRNTAGGEVLNVSGASMMKFPNIADKVLELKDTLTRPVIIATTTIGSKKTKVYAFPQDAKSSVVVGSLNAKFTDNMNVKSVTETYTTSRKFISATL